jgi:protein kinase-like protein
MRLLARHAPPGGLAVGSVVGGHVVGDLVDRRGIDELIYEARTPDGRDATLVSALRPLPDRRARIRFRRLARLRTTLDHPALLSVRAFGEHAGVPYVVMDPYPARTMAHLLDGGPLRPEAAAVLLAPVCEALDMAHARGLVHQTLGAASLLIAGEHIVLDAFGLTAVPDPIWGTFDMGGPHILYGPPEELRREPLEPASNVYSLSALLVHALTGRVPYDEQLPTLLYAHLLEPPPKPCERVPELGPALDDVIASGMAKEAWRRPSSAGALLRAVTEALGVAFPMPPGAPAAGPRVRGVAAGRLRRHLSTAAVIALVAAAGATAGVVAEPFGETAVVPASSDPRVVDRLDERRRELRARLAKTRVRQDQSAIAAQLAAAYGEAAQDAHSSRFAAAVRAARDAYAQLSAAADAGSRSRFAAGSQAVSRAELGVAAAVRSMP